MEIDSEKEAQIILKKTDANEPWDKHMAVWVSRIASPPLVGLASLILTAAKIDNSSGWIWAGIFSLITIAIPVTYVLWKVHIGEITDFNLLIRSQRIRPYLLVLGCVSVTWIGLWLGKAPALLILFGAMIIFQVSLMLAITLRWKISGHTAVIGSMVVFLLGLYGISALATILAIPLVAWSRVRLERHSAMQTVAGATVGILFMIGLFSLVFVYCHEPTLACVTR